MGIMEFFANQKAKKKEKEECIKAVEEELRAKISRSPVIDLIIDQMKEESWILNCQNAKDNGRRKVVLTADTIEISWYEWREESEIIGYNSLGIAKYGKKRIKDCYGLVRFSYTKSGYAPLDNYNGVVTIPLARVIEFWRDEKIRRMQQICRCSIDTDSQGFVYYIEKPKRTMF